MNLNFIKPTDMAKEKFDVKELHQESQQRIAKRTDMRNRDAKNHHQREDDVNVTESYKQSLELCKDEDGEVDEEKVKHLESVLAAGPIRYDR